MIVSQDPQSQLPDLPFAEFVFNEDHPLLRLSAAIRWDNLLEQLGAFYDPDKGRPCAPLRAQAGTLILKHVKDLADRAAVGFVQENIYAQRFCGLGPAQASDYMNPATGLSNFRAKIGPEGMAVIEEVLTCAAEGRRLARGGKLIVDTTCVPLDIIYPTDIRLLERCRRAIVRLLKQAKGFGVEALYRTYNRTARKIFVTFSKLSKPSEKTRRRVHKRLFQFVRRNVKQLADLREKATRALGPRCALDPELRGWLQGLKTTELRVRAILHQQKLVRRGIVHIPHRIVSFHKDHVRPIVRGKFPLATEFGPKVLFALVRGCMYRVAAYQDNAADALMIAPALRWFYERFGRLPREILGDRGFFARWRVKALKAMGVVPGLQQRGKVIEKSAAHRRQIRQRLPIEARISLGKRKFGWGRCRARIDEHETSWIGLGAAALNAHIAFVAQPP
ncbi:transposase [bacterium]|nr:transposase [bacterium]